MDVLRKVEEAKHPHGESKELEPATAEDSGLSLEPLLATAPLSALPHPSPRPVLAQHLDSLNDGGDNLYVMASVASSSTQSSNNSSSTLAAPVANSDLHEEQERNVARNVFAVKRSQRARIQRWFFLGLLVTALLGISGYFWWQVHAFSRGISVRSVAQTVAAPSFAALPVPTVPAVTQLPVLFSKLAGSPLAEEAHTQPGKPGRGENPQRQSGSLIKLSTRQPKENPVLIRAYEALQAEQLSDAQHDYEQVLRHDQRSIDALLGLASIAERQGEWGNAADLYLRALEVDPKDLNALAGLINLKGQADPVFSESRLQTLLTSQPESSVLNFALGNLQASQNRWSDAQLAYFHAYTAEPNNADYLYNLAVSLDHLHQNKLAVQYYQSALNAAGTRETAFDKKQLKNRLLDLQP